MPREQPGAGTSRNRFVGKSNGRLGDWVYLKLFCPGKYDGLIERGVRPSINLRSSILTRMEVSPPKGLADL
jgi:hypothetical protein